MEDVKVSISLKVVKNEIGADGKPTGDTVVDKVLEVASLVFTPGKNNYVAVTHLLCDENFVYAVSTQALPKDRDFLLGRTTSAGTLSGLKARLMEEVNKLPLDTGVPSLVASVFIQNVLAQTKNIKCSIVQVAPPAGPPEPES